MALVNIAVGIGSTIQQNNIVTSPEQLKQLVQAAISGAVQTDAAQIAELATEQLRVTQAAALAMLRSLGHDNVPVERLPDMLVSATTQILAMREALSRPSNEGSEIGELRRRAVYALDAGRFEEATRLLNRIRTQEQDVSEQRRRAAAESRADWLAGLQSEAEACALLARAALAQRDATGAFDRFEEGLGVLAPAEPERRWSYAVVGALAIHELGRSAGLNDALAAAIRLYEQALGAAPRERVPLEWAATQNNLGNALQMLGERESGIAKLEQAVEAYQAALQEQTRERVPLDWAITQNNLGNALQVLGERESGIGKLEQAVKAFQAALLELTPEAVLNWHEIAQRNLTRTLALLEKRRKQ
jgi:tetratricopeptide (TPR) repeat protein